LVKARQMTGWALRVLMVASVVALVPASAAMARQPTPKPVLPAVPSQPDADQLGWLAEMERASGADFDRLFVERLRSALGKIFPVIGDVRSGTRNDVIRALAQAAAVITGASTVLRVMRPC
jgi:hypothetical protein